MSAIGGFLGLELTSLPSDEVDGVEDSCLLNTGRNALGLILEEKGIEHLWIPYYSCRVLLQPLEERKIPYTYYFLDEALGPRLDPDELGPREALLYINYFGVRTSVERSLVDRFPCLILDRCQAFFEPLPDGSTPAFFSMRKFFGVPDGAIVQNLSGKLSEEWPEDRSQDRFHHLLKRCEDGPEAAYPAFKAHEEALDDIPPRRISPLSRRVYQGIAQEKVKAQRKQNFDRLHQKLKGSNELTPLLESENIEGPLAYPYLRKGGQSLRDHLIGERIYCPTYWPRIDGDIPPVEGAWELHLQGDLVPLPIDQRYGEEEMETIIERIRAFDERQ